MDEALQSGLEAMEYSEDSAAATATEDSALEEASAEYLGRWNRLVSTTNWEKGRIISEWRRDLLKAKAPSSAYSDEAWSRRVGNVTPQHVGRLRRVFEQFGEVCTQYSGLYWSHFQAVLDWHDAEMWLEGALQNGWSVARMRTERWEATGGAPEAKPRDEDVVAYEMDEADSAAEEPVAKTVQETVREVQDPEASNEVAEEDASEDDAPFDTEESMPEVARAVEPVRPFENLPTLPPDMADAFESFKLAILQHKISGWQEVACGEVLTALEALKQLALAPAEA